MSWFRNKREATEHKYAQERLSAYLDQELAPGEQGRVERHLAACSQCRCELDNLRRTVQWTMELPVMPCPRAFTVPAPARPQRARSTQRVWAMPLLQGATALVAVLFLLAVVGEAFLPGGLPASAPTPEALAREAAPEAEITQIVEVQAVELQVEAAPMMGAEAPAETAAPAEPMAAAEEITAKSAEDQAAAAAASAAPPGMGIGGDFGVEPTQVAVEGTPPPPSDLVGATGGGPLASETPEPMATSEPTLTATPEPTATPVPTATLVPTLASAPTLVAAVEQSAAVAEAAQPGERTAAEQQPPWQREWLATAVIALGVAFVLLGTLTATLMVRRLRRL